MALPAAAAAAAPPLAPDAFPCPAGRYGNTTGLTTDACSTACVAKPPDDAADFASCAPALCEEGFFCPEASTHGRQRECGEGFFCPPGAAAPVPVDDGLVGVGGGGPTTRTGQATCPTCCPNGVPDCAEPRAILYAEL